MTAGPGVRTGSRPMTRGARVTRVALLAVSIAFLGLLLLAPLGAVLIQALAKGVGGWFAGVTEPDTVAAIKLTLLTAAIGAFEALLFSMMGRIVDWLAAVAPARLWTEQRTTLLALAGVYARMWQLQQTEAADETEVDVPAGAPAARAVPVLDSGAAEGLAPETGLPAALSPGEF